jgi:uncharacterized protein YutE (UPF0331/DUF86 family)
MIEAESREQRVLDILQARYEAEGFTFTRHPSSAELPDFLRQLVPDAIVRGKGKNIVIEIKSSRRSQDQALLQRMTRILQAHPGWTFHIVYADDLSSTDDQLAILDKSSVDRHLKNIDKLIDEGNRNAAVMLVWALLEAVSRRYSERAGGQPKSINSVIEYLEREGYVSISDARRLYSLATLRNAITHGDLDRPVELHDVQFIMDVIKSLNATEPA